MSAGNRSLALSAFNVLSSALNSPIDESIITLGTSATKKALLGTLVDYYKTISASTEVDLPTVTDVFEAMQIVLSGSENINALNELELLRAALETNELVTPKIEPVDSAEVKTEARENPREDATLQRDDFDFDFDNPTLADSQVVATESAPQDPIDIPNTEQDAALPVEQELVNDELIFDGDTSSMDELPYEPLSDVALKTEHLPVLSYAMSHNQLGVFSRVLIANGGAERGPVQLHLDALSGNKLLGSLTTEPFYLPDGGSAKENIEGVPVVTKKLPEINLPLNPDLMRQILTTSPGTIRARLEWRGKIIAREEVHLPVLSAMRWAVTGNYTSLQMLSAYVLPHEPVVQQILKEASSLLKGSGKDPSIEGYQSDPDRVDEIVWAIGTAIRNRNLTYTNPPATWELIVEGKSVGGQSVRTPTEVLDGTGGTCLDTTLVMAAALEQAGINPVLWLIRGHAFLGYWRTDKSFDSPVELDPGLVATRINSGAGMGFVETTKLTSSYSSSTWQEIQAEPLGMRMSADWSNFHFVVDVAACRRQQILPIDVRTLDDSDGSVNIITYNPKFVGGTPRTFEGVERERPDRPNETPQRIVSWKNTLLDLSASNSLIKFRPKSAAKLTVPADRIGQLEDMVNAGSALTLMKADSLSAIAKERGLKTGDDLPSEVLADFMENQGHVFTNLVDANYDRLLRGLQLSAKNYRQETGANNLYLSFGMLNWQSGPTELSSPLVLVPVKLETVVKKGDYRIVLDDAGESAPNFCLLEKLSRELDIEIPGLKNPATDQSGIDLEAAFSAVAEAIEKSKKGFTLERSVYLGTLQFAKYRIWKDLDENWHNFVENPLVKHLTYSHTDPFEEPTPIGIEADLEELYTKVPLPADGSQLVAVQKALHGRTFVLEGPPGTGKSQAISNMLARLISEGKKVLFVAEKGEALKVVRRRLDDAGLGALTLDAHDKGAKPAAIKAQLQTALDLVAEYDEGQFGAASQAVSAARAALLRYRDRLSSQNGAGYDLHRAVITALEEHPVDALPLTQSFVESASADQIQDIRDAIQHMIHAVGPARPSAHHPWRFVADSSVDISASVTAALAFDEAVQALLASPEGRQLAEGVTNQAETTALLGILRGPRVSSHDVLRARLPEWQAQADAFVSRVKQTLSIPRPQLLTFDPTVLELDLDQIAASAIEAEKLRFGAKREMREALAAQFTPYLRPGKKIKEKAITETCAALSAIKSAGQQVVSESQSIAGLQLPAGFNVFAQDVVPLIAYRQEWLAWAAGFLANDGNYFRPEFIELVKKIIDSPLNTETLASVWENYEAALTNFAKIALVDDREISRWGSEQGVASMWSKSAAARGHTASEMERSLTAWLAFAGPANILIALGLDETRQRLLDGLIHPDDADEGLEIALASVSVEERLTTTGLADFDATSHERQIDRYRAGIAKIRQQLPGMLPKQIIEKRPFNAEATTGRIGQLRMQLAKQKGGLTVRGIFREFGDIISAVTPCVMMSPESVARLIPAQPGMFDIVVFDEASQLRVADSIGAMGRANAVVVVGDSRQMPPTSFFDSSSTSDSSSLEVDSLDELMDVMEDQESILSECKQCQVPTDTLTWHYRSRDESLISFSNDAYYESKLASFPTPHFGTRDDGVDGYGISFRHIKVAELPNKERNAAAISEEKKARAEINRKVADAIVAEVVKRFAAADEDEIPSIGIVTFSVEETKLIDGLLRATNDKIRAALEDDEGIFVKSIEFVQGDERDTILFFVSKPVQGGEVSLVGYGSLAKQGGERRLNVAITRARRQVVVFSSFLPNQLPYSRATNPGVKDFGRYLEEAYRGSDKAMSDPYRTRVVDKYRDEVAQKLRERGYGATTDVGLSDFRVDISVASKTKPDVPIAALLLDGPKWASRLTVADRDALPVEVLGDLMAWPSVQRIWLADWLNNPESSLDRVCEAIDAAAAGQVYEAPTSFEEDGFDLDGPLPSTGANQIRGDAAPSGPSRSDLNQYLAWPTSVTHNRDFLDYLPHNRQAVAGVQQIIRDIVEFEGPIHETRLVKLVAAQCSLTRVNEARQQSIIQQIPKDLGRPSDEEFVWPADLDPNDWRGFRVNSENSTRSIDVISWRELANAMAHLTSENLGMHADELKRATLNFFNGVRLTDTVTSKLDEAITKGLNSGRLVSQPNGVIAPGAGF